MEADKFELNKSNIILLIIVVVLVIFNAIFGIMLIISLNKEQELPPNLETTMDKTSTLYQEETTSYITTTTTTKAIRSSSPYYDVSSDSILTEEILIKEILTRDEKIEVLKIYNNFLDSLFNTSNNDIFDIESTIKVAKENESDKIVFNNKSYGEIYNYKAIFDKAFTSNFKLFIENVKYNDVLIFKEDSDKLYRVENILGNKYPVYENDDKLFYLMDTSSSIIEARIYYYFANYKEEGKTSPVIEYTNITLRYDKGRWRVDEYTFPNYKR